MGLSKEGGCPPVVWQLQRGKWWYTAGWVTNFQTNPWSTMRRHEWNTIICDFVLRTPKSTGILSKVHECLPKNPSRTLSQKNIYAQSKWRVGSRRLAQWNLRPRGWVCSHSPPPAVPSPPASPAAAASSMRCGFGWRWSSKKCWEPAAAGSTNTSAAFRSFKKWPVKPTCAKSCWENGRNWEKPILERIIIGCVAKCISGHQLFSEATPSL